MQDSTSLYEEQNFSELKTRLQKEGFLLIRNVVSSSLLEEIRSSFLDLFETHKKQKKLKGLILDLNNGSLALGSKFYHEKDLQEQFQKAKYKIPNLTFLIKQILGPSWGELPSSSWLRLKGKKDGTVDHVDYFYFKKKYPNLDQELYTCWVSLSDLKTGDSMLALVPKSHTQFTEYSSPKKELPGDFKSSNATWQTPTHLSTGDIILFHYKTIHGAPPNGDTYRFSLDTRFIQCL